MEKKLFADVLKRYSIQDIEKHLFFLFLEQHSLLFSENRLLSEYFEGFEENESLLGKIKLLDVNSVEDLASTMELLIPDRDKKSNGAFFTPPYIVDYIIREVAPGRDSKVVDLSCGSGLFLLGVLKYITRKYKKSIRQCLRENVYGVDVLSCNVARSKILLTIMALMDGESISERALNVWCADSVREKWSMKFDCVVGNPPYVKFQDLDDGTRNYLLENFSTTKFGTFNLYFAFFEVGLSLLTEKGRLGYITPNNYFTSLSGECLRSYFQCNKSVYKIVDFSSVKIFSVQTYTAMTFLDKKRNEVIDYARISRGERPMTFLGGLSFTKNDYDYLNVKKWRLLCGNERENIKNIEQCGDAIGSMFNICVGIATLKDEVYFITPNNEDEMYYYLERKGRTYKIEKTLTRPLVKISDAKSQIDITRNTRKIIFPYKTSDGKVIAIQEEEMRTCYPCCFEYLLSVREILEKRSKGKHVYKPFYAYGRTQGLSRRGVKLLTPTFSKVPRFLLDYDEFAFFTNGYGVYIKERNNMAFANPMSFSANMDVLQKVLNSVIMAYYVEKTSVSIEGGYPCYQKNFIEKFSIPVFSDSEVDSLRNMNDKKEIDSFLMHKYHLNFPLPNRSS